MKEGNDWSFVTAEALDKAIEGLQTENFKNNVESEALVHRITEAIKNSNKYPVFQKALLTRAVGAELTQENVEATLYSFTTGVTVGINLALNSFNKEEKENKNDDNEGEHKIR